MQVVATEFLFSHAPEFPPEVKVNHAGGDCIAAHSSLMPLSFFCLRVLCRAIKRKKLVFGLYCKTTPRNQLQGKKLHRASSRHSCINAISAYLMDKLSLWVPLCAFSGYEI